MGKKRSKTAKQRQARASASKRFGVSVKKGGGREQQTTSLVLQVGSGKRRPKYASSSTSSSGRTKPSFVKTRLPLQHHDDEQADFDKQWKSMEERQQSIQQTKKKRNKSLKLKSWTANMAPATLLINDKDKSTQQLVEEATTKIHALNKIGQSNQLEEQQKRQMTSNRLQVLAAQQRAAWNSVKVNTAVSSQNAFIALQQSDSEEEDTHGWGDNEEHVSVPKPAAPLFQFAPASFSLPASSKRQADEDDDDPDL